MYNINGKEYVSGRDRNEDKAVVHLYEGTFDNVGNPMCARGWNRSNEFGFSIFRNSFLPSCKVCLRRAYKGLKSIDPKKRKTKWI